MVTRRLRRTAALLGALLCATLWASVVDAGGPVHVRGYVRHDGTYVAPHTRAAPGTAGGYTSPSHRYSVPGVERDSDGHIKRSSSARRQFLKSQGLDHTPAGCQVDHVTPLSKGGRDDPGNMQLLCGDALRAKERSERR